MGKDEFNLGLGAGLVIGIILMTALLMSSIYLQGVVISEDVADEVCLELYGNNIEYVDGKREIETTFNCKLSDIPGEKDIIKCEGC